ncbi:hypothetical protein [Fluviispira vulneris]|uniref:hypothetical protein n=1 Tax=Fluviispira vulneris TaxID=2763012 RepID=UPI0016445207|nr:hypothetical protein [Fluviispira vulneris]
MEALINKIYEDPICSLRNLSNMQLDYFYNYFKHEYFYQSHYSSQECFKDKKQVLKIYRSIKKEKFRRLPETI